MCSRNLQRFFFCLTLAILCLLRPSTLRADFRLTDAIQEFGEKRFAKPQPTRLRLGPVRVHPSIANKATYDSNVFLEDQDAKEDVIFHVQPGAILELPMNRHQVTIGYEADFEIFSKGRDSKHNDANQNFFSLTDLNFPTWYINVLEQLMQTSSRAGTTFTERIPRVDESIYPKIGKRWKRMTFETGYHYFLRHFKRITDKSLDFRLHEWMGVIYYDWFARLKALLDGQVSRIDYLKNTQRNGVMTQSRVGVEGEVIPNLLVKFRTGFQIRNYSKTSDTDFGGWVASGEVDYQWRENVLFKVSAERVPLEATYGNVNYYMRNIMRFRIEYKVRPKWTLIQGAKFYIDNYSESATLGTVTVVRHDRQMSYLSGIRYMPQEWLIWELEYELFRRDSNLSTFDYTDHQLSFTSTIAY